MTRRHFMQASAGATLSALVGGAPRQVWGAPKIEAQTETFDPKRYTPFERGLACEKVLSTFPAIDTAVDGIKLSQGLENVAKVMDRATLIRSHRLADLGHILHSRHQ